MTRPTHIFFDVNETLIDIAPLREAVSDKLGGGAGQADRWFNALIEYSLAETLSGEPSGFSDIAAAVLVMLCAQDGQSLGQEDAKEIVKDGLQRSQAYDDAAPGLARLQEAGFKLVALTNSGADGLEERLADAGLAKHFDQLLSVQPSGAYKPDVRTYEYGLEKASGDARGSMMVACHPWDLIGAQAFGMQTAFIARPGSAWYPLANEPTHSVRDIDQLADTLLAIKKDRS